MFKCPFYLFSLVTLVGCAGSDDSTSPTITPAFVNGGFELPTLATNDWKANQDVVGSSWTGVQTWGIGNGSGSWGQSGRNSPQYAFVQSPGNLQQTVSGFRVGKRYRVTLWIARRNGHVGGNTGVPVKIFANNEEVMPYTSPPGDGSWTQVFSDSFQADSSAIAFRFQVQTEVSQDQSTLFDDILIEAVD
jgi:hypothetical protein